MGYKVELHPDVVRFLKWECNAAERDAFSALMRKLGDEPIKHSAPFRDPVISRYMIRRARFGSCIAVFSFDRARTKIRIRKCRRFTKNQLPQRRDEPRSDPGHDPGAA